MILSSFKAIPKRYLTLFPAFSCRMLLYIHAMQLCVFANYTTYQDSLHCHSYLIELILRPFSLFIQYEEPQ